MSRHYFTCVGSIALCQSVRFILAKSLSFLRHRTVTGSNPTLGKVIFSFMHKIRFCIIIIFYQYRGITSMVPRNPWIFDFIMYHLFMKIGQKLLEKWKFQKKFRPVNLKFKIFKQNIFEILRDLFSDINNTQNWIVVKFLVC